MNLVRLAKGQWEVLAAAVGRENCPILDALGKAIRDGNRNAGKILEILTDFVPAKGPPGNLEYCRELENGIFEFKKAEFRILWFYDQGRLIILTHCFQKKRRKTPRREITKACKTREEYLVAKKAENLIIAEL